MPGRAADRPVREEKGGTDTNSMPGTHKQEDQTGSVWKSRHGGTSIARYHAWNRGVNKDRGLTKGVLCDPVIQLFLIEP